MSYYIETENVISSFWYTALYAEHNFAKFYYFKKLFRYNEVCYVVLRYKTVYARVHAVHYITTFIIL